MQAKSYPRDWMVPGRVRVKLLNDDGKPVNPDVPNSERRRHVQTAMLLPDSVSTACH